MPQRIATSSASAPETRSPSRRRGWRWFSRIVIALLVLALAAALIITRTGVAGAVVLSRLEAAIGCEAAAQDVQVTLDGLIIIRGLELRVPGISGPGGLFLQTTEMTIEPAWLSLLGSSPAIRRLWFRQPVLRICQDESLTLNLQRLKSGSSKGAGLVPTVDVTDGAIEFGEFGPGWYTGLQAVRVHGKLARVAPGSSRYTVQLIESQPTGASRVAEPLNLTGEFDLATLDASVRLGNVDLARLAAGGAPARIDPVWRQLALSGRLKETVLTHTANDGLAAVLSLERVDMNIPVPADAPSRLDGAEAPVPVVVSGPVGLLRMRDVSGTIRFDHKGLHAALEGLIEDLPCAVDFETEGYSLDSALVCRIRSEEFRVADQPRLLPMAPRVVKRNFRRFSGPTAIVNGEVEIRRSAPGPLGPGAVAVNGLITFTHGSARFEKFPYPFENLAGAIRFDETKVWIENITGVGPTGAQLHATGEVAPPADGASVDVRIHVTNLPADDVLYDAIPEDRRVMFDALFSRARFEELQRKGVVQSADRRRQAEEHRAELLRLRDQMMHEGQDDPELERVQADMEAADAQLAIPVFALAGVADVMVHVRREQGEDVSYQTAVDVSLSEAGMLAEAFPYPIIAQQFHLSIREDGAVAESPSMRGLTGAAGRMRADVEFRSGAADDFQIDVNVVDVPVDAALLAALEWRDTKSGAGSPAGGAPPRDGFNTSSAVLTRALGLSGAVSCDARIESSNDGDVRFQVDVGIDDMLVQPLGGDLRITGANGRLEITQNEFHLRNLRGAIGDALVTADLDLINLNSAVPEPSHLSAAIQFTGLDIQQPVELLVEAISPSHARAMRDLRQAHVPAGRVDALVNLGVRAKDVAYQVELANPRDVSFDAMGGRVAIIDSSGELTVGHDALRCRGFEARLAFADAPAGRVTLDGAWSLIPKDASIPDVDRQLSVQLEGAQFASPMVQAVAGHLDSRVAGWLTSLEVGGAFDAAGVARSGGRSSPTFEGSVYPRTFELSRHGVRTRFENCAGHAHFSPGGANFNALSGAADDWSTTINGSWTPDNVLNLRYSLDSLGLPASLDSILPHAIRRTFQEISLEIGGALSVRGGELTVSDWDNPAGASIDARLTAAVEYARADVGTPLHCPLGEVSLIHRSRSRQGEPLIELALSAPFVFAADIPLTDARAYMRSASEPGVYLIEQTRAHVHGGDVALTGSLRLGARSADPEQMRASAGNRRSGGPQGSGGLGVAGGSGGSGGSGESGGAGGGAESGGGGTGGGAYELELRASSVDFGHLLAGLVGPPHGSEAPAPPAELGSRGTLEAFLGLAGTLGDPDSRRGIGILRIQGGEVVALPGLTGLLRLSNLQPPIGETLGSAFARFHVRGDTIEFARIEAASRSLAIIGEGSMKWPSTELDLRFNTQGLTKVPILSDLFRGLRDEIVSTAMTGTLRNPQSRLVQLPATRRMLGAIFRAESRGEPPQASPLETAPPVLRGGPSPE